MYKLLSLTIVTFGLIACGGSSKDSVTPVEVTTPPVTEPDQFSALRNTIELELSANNAVAVSVAIYQQGEIVFAEAFGEKIQGRGEMPTANTLFQLGSTTKMFTGLATLQLVEQESLTIQDKLVNTLPNIQYPSAQALSWQEVNIHHLLTHQGGFLDDYIGSSDTDELVEYMTSHYPQQNPQMNPPGLFHNYSNPNWSYLGAIIEHLSQTPFAEHMQQNVFAPLGMQRTSMQRSIVKADGDYALGFQTNGVDATFMTDIEQIYPWPSGIPAGSETWSTPTEQLKMAEFLLKGNTEVLSDELRETIFAPQVDTEFAGLPMYYGYGLYVDDGFIFNDQWYPEKVWHHGGNTTAYTSMFWILPDKDIAISIMSSGAYDDFEGSMMAALTLLTDLPSPQAIPVDPVNQEEFGKHVGHYVFEADAFTVEVWVENQQLQFKIPEYDAINLPYQQTMTAIGDNTFIATLENENMVVTFIPAEEGGESVYLRNRTAVGIKDGYSSMAKALPADAAKPMRAKKRILD
jgi:CubicO group peptidase (beta-lactamase class C family)